MHDIYILTLGTVSTSNFLLEEKRAPCVARLSFRMCVKRESGFASRPTTLANDSPEEKVSRVEQALGIRSHRNCLSFREIDERTPKV